MGLSDIAKAPVSHGVEPHDLETGPDLRVPRQPMARSPRSSLLPRERFSPRADSGHSPYARRTTAWPPQPIIHGAASAENRLGVDERSRTATRAGRPYGALPRAARRAICGGP